MYKLTQIISRDKNVCHKAFSREKKRALMEAQDAFGAQAEAMAGRLREEAKDSLQQVPLDAAANECISFSLVVSPLN